MLYLSFNNDLVKYFEEKPHLKVIYFHLTRKIEMNPYKLLASIRQTLSVS